jgi:cytochrome c-type biogenesis protein CcmF
MIGTVVLAVAFLAGLGATAAFGRAYVRDERPPRSVTALVAATGGALVAALSFLTLQFVTTDFSNAYVWENTAEYLPLLYRVTGVYAGNAGSILLWAALASIVSLWAVAARSNTSRSTSLVHAITMGVVTYFVGMLLLRNPFASVLTKFPEAPPGFVPARGQGLNPLLVDPYMAIHPPVMFTAYALLAMPFAIGAAHFVSLFRTGEGIFADWLGSVTRWLRVSWLFLTGAVALGGLWSYTVLGWGGIWAWDPVETAILVPWLFLTATLHAVTNYDPDGEYALLAPAMTATGFALAVYTTSVVRSGVFRSVHSFATGGIGAALLGLMAVTAAFGVGLPVAYWILRGGDDDGREATDAGGLQSWLTRSNLLHLAVLLLGLLTFISMWGLTFPVLRDLTTGIEVSVEPTYYNLWSYPVVLSVLLLLGFYMDYDVEGQRRSLFGLGVFATATVAAAFLAPSETWHLAESTPTDALFYRVVGEVSVLSMFPPVAYVAIGVIKRGMERIPAGTTRDVRYKETGIVLIHLGVALLAFSLPFTYLFTAQASVIATGVGPDGVQGGATDVPNSEYSLRVHGYEERRLPEDPAPGTYARTPAELLQQGQAINGTVQTVHGKVTRVRQGSSATVVQLNGSGLWLGLTGGNASSAPVERGQHVVARGGLAFDYVPQADAILMTNAENVGTTANPPASAQVTRVTTRSVDLSVYRNGDRVAAGTAGQSQYLAQNGMQVRDVVVSRGLVADTYVIAGLSDGTASVTVKRIPLMTAIRASILMLLTGMTLVLVFDPMWGLWRLVPGGASFVNRGRRRTETEEPATD